MAPTGRRSTRARCLPTSLAVRAPSCHSWRRSPARSWRAARRPVESLGVAVPGLYIPESGVVTFLTNVPGDWSATPVGAPVATATGLPTALINDARAFGLAELRFGAGRDVRSFVGLTLGTGIGGVFAIDDQVIQGYRGQAGELGHQTIDPDGPWCGCGNRGCVEAYARADQVALVCGTADPREAIERARAGDERARAGLAEIGRYLGIGIANAITMLTPERRHPGRRLGQRRRAHHRAHQGGAATTRHHHTGGAGGRRPGRAGHLGGRHRCGGARCGARGGRQRHPARGPSGLGPGLRSMTAHVPGPPHGAHGIALSRIALRPQRRVRGGGQRCPDRRSSHLTCSLLPAMIQEGP